MPISQKTVLGLYARLTGIRNTIPLFPNAMAEIALDYNKIVEKIGKELGENLSEFAVPGGAFWRTDDHAMVYTEILRFKLAQLAAYLEQVYHLNSAIIEIGTLYNSIHDPVEGAMLRSVVRARQL